MSETQSPEEFKLYFVNNFTNLFIKLINESIENIVDDETLLNDMNKLKLYTSGEKKLNYSKIMLKLSTNEKLLEVLTTLDKFGFEDKGLSVAAKKYKDIWAIIPSLNILKLLFNYKDLSKRRQLYKRVLKMYSCSLAYKDIHDKSNDFNPSMSITNYSENYGINDIMEHNEIKTPDSYEFMVDMITKQFLGENGDKELNEQIQNMGDKEINNATTNLNNLLTDKVKDGNKSAEILTDMIGKLKHKLGDLKNTKNDGNGLQNILNIAKEITSEMTSNVDKDMIDPEDLWNTTSQLASQTVDSPAIDAIGLMVRNQIAKAKNNTKVSKEELNEDVMNVMSKLNIN